jgi:hypothetical protein
VDVGEQEQKAAEQAARERKIVAQIAAAVATPQPVSDNVHIGISKSDEDDEYYIMDASNIACSTDH